jgi:hypothetical protein
MTMKHQVIIHRKNDLQDLYDRYSSEREAKEAIRTIAAESSPASGTVLTPSGSVTFNGSDFAGAEYRIDDSDEVDENIPEA